MPTPESSTNSYISNEEDSLEDLIQLMQISRPKTGPGSRGGKGGYKKKCLVQMFDLIAKDQKIKFLIIFQKFCFYFHKLNFLKYNLNFK